jgi:hypothetical protein
MSNDKPTISAADLKALAEAYKNAKPEIKDAASLARAGAGIMKSKK